MWHGGHSGKPPQGACPPRRGSASWRWHQRRSAAAATEAPCRHLSDGQRPRERCSPPGQALILGSPSLAGAAAALRRVLARAAGGRAAPAGSGAAPGPAGHEGPVPYSALANGVRLLLPRERAWVWCYMMGNCGGTTSPNFSSVVSFSVWTCAVAAPLPLIVSLELNFGPPGMFRLKCGRQLLIYLVNQSHLFERSLRYVCFLCMCVYLHLLFTFMYISLAQCKWSAGRDVQKFQAGCHEMKVTMCCAGLRHLLQGLSFSAKYYSKHNPPQTVCPFSKIVPKKCHILGCSKGTCTHRTAPPGSILPCRFFSCKVCRPNTINYLGTSIRDPVILFTCWRNIYFPEDFKQRNKVQLYQLFSRTRAIVQLSYAVLT